MALVRTSCHTSPVSPETVTPVAPKLAAQATLPSRLALKPGSPLTSRATRKLPLSSAVQPPLHRLGAFGKAEGDRGLAVDPRHAEPATSRALRNVLRADPETLERRSQREIAPLADRHRDAERPGFDRADA